MFLISAGYSVRAVFPLYHTRLHDATDRVLQMVSRYEHYECDTSIDIIESHTELAIDVLPRFHSTFVMNGISAYDVFMMYPQSTLKMKSLARACDVSERIKTKYEKRGVTFVFSNDDTEEPCLMSCPAILRGVSRPGTMLYAPLKDTHLQSPPHAIPSWKTWVAPIRCTNAACTNCKVVSSSRPRSARH